MDPASREDLHIRLSGLVILLEHRLGSEAANLICDFVEVGEYGLALEELISRWQGRPSPTGSATT
jgi:hypothetical protein